MGRKYEILIHCNEIIKEYLILKYLLSKFLSQFINKLLFNLIYFKYSSI